MPGIDPVSLSLSAAQFGLGALQSVFSGKRKAERNLENYANSYQPNSSILDVYNKALSRYSSNPYTSQFYQQQQNQIQRNLATSIGSAQDRRGGLATVGVLNQQANDASSRAGVQAESMQGQQLSQLQSAAGQKAQAQDKKYDLLYNLKAMKAGAANATRSAGLQNMFGAIGGASMAASAADSLGGAPKPNATSNGYQGQMNTNPNNYLTANDDAAIQAQGGTYNIFTGKWERR